MSSDSVHDCGADVADVADVDDDNDDDYDVVDDVEVVEKLVLSVIWQHYCYDSTGSFSCLVLVLHL